MHPHTLISSAKRFLSSNAPSVMTGVGIAGVVTTAYLAGKGGFKARAIVGLDEVSHRDETPHDRFVRRTKLTWKCYIPAVGTGAVTVAAIVGANQVSTKRTAAAITAYSLTQSAFDDYKEAVGNQLTKNQGQKIRDEVAEKRVAAVRTDGVVIVGEGDVLCLEQHTGRVIMSTVEKLRRACNSVNEMMLYRGRIDHRDGSADLNDFYDELDIPHTSTSSTLGWDLEGGLLAIEISSHLTDDERPVVAFNYSYLKPVAGK